MNLPQVQDFIAISPAIVLTGAGLLLLIVQFLVGEKKIVIYYLSLIALFSALGLQWYTGFRNPGTGIFFNNQYSISYITIWLNMAYLIVGICIISALPVYFEKSGIHLPEVYPLLLFCITGMMFMTSGFDLLLIFIGVELVSIPLYILIALNRNNEKSVESALKYFLLGAFTSGFMLLGIALLYGGSGSTNLLSAVLSLDPTNPLRLYSISGFGFFMMGVLFKAGIFPFHSWSPDVYEGANTHLTAFMAAAPKAAALGLLLIFFSIAGTPELWATLLGVFAILSMTYGNVVALRQSSLKRMLAYSSISHAGYVAAGIACGGTTEVLFYILVYAITNILSFGLVAILEIRKGSDLEMADLTGLSKSYPFESFSLLAVFFSLGGIPPLFGFWTKLYLFQQIAYSAKPLSMLLLIAGVINSAIAIYYYLQVTVNAYMKESDNVLFKQNPFDIQVKIVLILGVLVVLFGWIFASPSMLPVVSIP